MPSNDISYYDNVNTSLLETIPSGAQVVLEIGCGAGRLGAHYKSRNPDCTYYGVEIDGRAAAIAAGRLNMVLCGSVESVNLDFLKESVDCIVYGDVLEHLIDPWKVIQDHKALLKPEGKIAACIPNVQNWEVVLDLLRGRWTYQDSGQLDRTHLRFFTLDSVLSLFQTAGLKVENLLGISVGAEKATQLAETLSPSLGALGIDAEAFRTRLAVSQYVVLASRG
jgi:SAM-dependent methyltransferase